MIDRISWTECLSYLAIGLIIYYAAVVVIFYRAEFIALLKRRAQSSQREAHKSTDQTQAAPEGGLYNEVLELLQDCKPVFNAAVEHSLEKSQVIEALRVQLKKYPQIIGTAFQVAVSNHIDQELQARCGYSLTENDIKSLWR